jgi:flagellar biosynthesis protein FliP
VKQALLAAAAAATTTTTTTTTTKNKKKTTKNTNLQWGLIYTAFSFSSPTLLFLASFTALIVPSKVD